MLARLTRRRMLYQTSLGAAAAGMLPVAARLAAVEPQAAAIPAAAEAEAPAAATLTEPLVAYLHPTAQGALSLLVGSREIVVRDAELIARLVKAVH